MQIKRSYLFSLTALVLPITEFDQAIAALFRLVLSPVHPGTRVHLPRPDPGAQSPGSGQGR
jgi:hypothetical protein